MSANPNSGGMDAPRRFVHPIWFIERVYRRANIIIDAGPADGGIVSPMPNLTPEQQARRDEALHAEWIAFNDFWPHAGGGVKA